MLRAGGVDTWLRGEAAEVDAHTSEASCLQPIAARGTCPGAEPAILQGLGCCQHVGATLTRMSSVSKNSRVGHGFKLIWEMQWHGMGWGVAACLQSAAERVGGVGGGAIVLQALFAAFEKQAQAFPELVALTEQHA